MFRKLTAVLLAVAFLVACPHNTPNPNTPSKIDPYATARAVIQGLQLSIPVADGIFETWAAAQTDPEKVKKARVEYTRVRAAVAYGLRLAMDGVGIAEQAKTDPDVSKLLAKADLAWQDLRALLGDLLGPVKPVSTVPGAFAVKYPPLNLGDLPTSLVPAANVPVRDPSPKVTPVVDTKPAASKPAVKAPEVKKPEVKKPEVKKPEVKKDEKAAPTAAK